MLLSTNRRLVFGQPVRLNFVYYAICLDFSPASAREYCKIVQATFLFATKLHEVDIQANELCVFRILILNIGKTDQSMKQSTNQRAAPDPPTTAPARRDAVRTSHKNNRNKIINTVERWQLG
jgi:hypothetical protein